MKKHKYLAFAAAVFLGITAASAQLKYGPRVSLGYSSLGGGNGSLGVQGGLFVNAEFKDRMGVQPEVLFTIKNGSEDLEVANPGGNPLIWKKKYSFTYIDIPIYAFLPVSKHLTILFGPQLGIVNRATSKLSGVGVSSEAGKRKDVTGTDAGMGFAAGLDIHSSSPLRFGIRYSTTGGEAFTGRSSFVSVTMAYIMDW